uniref:Uncharacterized protein n=1 Tax=Oryza brachyantha TaxID=4533 RepID=J3NEN5_ORYBR
MASVVSKNSPPARHEDGVAAPPALDKDAVLRRIRHRRRANRPPESLQSLLLTQQAAAPPPAASGEATAATRGGGIGTFVEEMITEYKHIKLTTSI